jgi:hypothetical protein
MNNYYVYFHINSLTNQIFYVGKGKGKRAYTKTGRNNFWKRIVKKYGWIVNIVEDNLTSEQALEREIFYIKKIGRTNLCNLTDGGDGRNNYKASEETKQKMSIVRKGERLGKDNPMFGKPPWNKDIKRTDIISEKHPKSKKIIDEKSGIIFNTIREAAKYHNMCEVLLSRYLSGNRKNKTNLKYYI